MINFNLNDPYHRLFYEETSNHLDLMEKKILSLEKAGVSTDMEEIHNLFRIAHSVKGSCATLALTEMVAVSHELENLLDNIRKKSVIPNTKWFTVCLKAVDTLRNMLKNAINNKNEPLEIQKLVLELKEISNQKSAERMLKVFVSFEHSTVFLGIKAVMVQKKIEENSSVIGSTPSDFDIDDELFNGQIEFIIKTSQSDKELSNAIQTVSDVELISIDHMVSSEDSCEESSEKNDVNPIVETTLKQESMKVHVEKINQINGWVEELIMDKLTLNNILSGLQNEGYKGPQLTRVIQLYEHLDRVSDALKNHLQELKLLPLKTIFERFPRIIRDLSDAHHVTIDFTMSGKEIGIDRNSLELLMDPLTHLIRNAFAHGFKNRNQGVLYLGAEQQSNHVIITIKDDGNGIDCDKIKERAITENLISPESAESFTSKECYEFIFKPGFTTTDSTSLVSGRGVGLDIVKANLLALKGTIEVESAINKGTLFTLKMPITQSVVQAIIVKSSGYQFAIPLIAVSEIMNRTSDESAFYNWKDQLIPIIKFEDLFGNTIKNSNNGLVLILSIAEKHLGLEVDDFLKEEEIVIQSMAHLIGQNKILKDVSYISGITLLSDGSMAFVLDTSKLLF